ncbi:MAG: hypothetical protein LCH67_03270 [Bacteroidetes bacterium]|nr:hypothetical protein [Bacteroidota bacterium]
MTERKNNIIESIGLLLILLSFLIQLIETDIESEIREAQFYQTQVKLDRVWDLLGKEYSIDNNKTSNSRYIEFQEINKHWKYYSQDKEYLDEWKKSVLFDFISKIRIWIFVLGSLILIIPKWIKRK